MLINSDYDVTVFFRARHCFSLVLIVSSAGCSSGIPYALICHLYITLLYYFAFKTRLSFLLLYQFRDIALYSPFSINFQSI